MKGCELCDRAARTFCESDQASLCWECDARVHGANFLVARHSRTLLCRRCQSETAWKAEGPRLGTTVSFCNGCTGKAVHKSRVEEDAEEEDMCDDGGERDSSDDDDEDEDEDDEDEEEDGDEGEREEEEEEEDESADNQVVPLALTPPPAVSSSSSDESSSRAGGGRFLKRIRADPDLSSSQDRRDSSSSHQPSSYAHQNLEEDEATSLGRPLPFFQGLLESRASRRRTEKAIAGSPPI